MTKDLFGKALLDYQNGNYTEDIITSTSISEDDVLSIPYLFRSFEAMPRLEQKALKLCKGSILDVGCGAGSHSLYLQEHGFDVKAIDISPSAIEVCKKRGVLKTECTDIINEQEIFDTILLLMNGSGVFRSLSQAPYFLNHLKNLLKPEGQILIDSSDIIYMYGVEDENEIEVESYYGELEYLVSYKGETESFPWIYLDFDNLKQCCNQVGLQCELVLEGGHFDFLARLSLPS